MTNSKRKDLFHRVGAWFAIGLGWQGFTATLENGRSLSPARIFSVAITDLVDPHFLVDVWTTGGEALSGLIIGSTIGTLVGIVMWRYHWFGRLISPMLSFLGGVPLFALAPVIILFTGVGMTSKIVVVFASTVVVAASHAYAGTQAANRDLLEFFVALKATDRQILQKVVLPGAMAWLATGLKVNIGSAMVAAFVAELISTNGVGLGHYISRHGAFYDVPRVLWGVIAMGLLTWALSSGVTWALGRILPWSTHREVQTY